MLRLLVTLIAAAALVAGGVAAENAFAQKGPKFKGPKATKQLEKKALKGKGLGIGGGNIFSQIERNIIKDFLGVRGGKKFKAKKFKHKSLPPGLAMQLRRNGILPPGLRRNYLPPGLSSRLPGLPPGQARVLVGNDVLLIQRATGLILDILSR